jgi:hypothetical protein
VTSTAQGLKPAQRVRQQHITEPRLAPYLAASDGDVTRALRLDDWNTELSGAVCEVLHRFEVLLRNAIDEPLRAWNSTEISRVTGRPHGSDWFLDPAPLLQRLTARASEQATPRARRAVAARDDRTMLHEDVVAQTSFGTWRFLLPDGDPGRRYLWHHVLSNTFTYLPAHLTGADVTAAVDRAYRLRNRVAHLEPLLDVRRVQAQVESAYQVAGWIDPELRSWLTGTQRVTGILKSRLRL